MRVAILDEAEWAGSDTTPANPSSEARPELKIEILAVIGALRQNGGGT
jgi:hypothetical protein